jgi:hypothetical protein
VVSMYSFWCASWKPIYIHPLILNACLSGYFPITKKELV